MHIKKASFIVVFLVLTSTFYIGLTFIPGDASAITHYVGGIGPGNYTRIQDAIDNASDGDTVYVYNGTYQEHVIVNKTLNLTGEDKDTTTINGGGVGDVVNVTSDWVNMTGFNITGSGSVFGDAAIELYGSDNCSIIDNAITANDAGISLVNSHNNQISYNAALSNWAGVFLQFSENNTISNNTSDNTYGILLRYSDNNIIIGNKVSNNLVGIQLGASGNVTIVDNVLSRNGISLSGSDNCNVTNNTVSRTTRGIRLWDSDNTTIARNIISEAHEAILVEISDFNSITNNNMSLGTTFGIRLHKSNNNTLRNNGISSSFWDGILVDRSINNTISNSTMGRNGIYLKGDSMEFWNSHVIDTTNTVSGKPVRFLKDTVGGSIPQDAGQVILANCTDVLVEWYNLTEVVAAVQIGFSSGSRVANNTVSKNNRESISLTGSTDSVIANNILSANGNSIQLQYSSRNHIAHNRISDSSALGIRVVSSDFNEIAWNDISNTGAWGILLQSSANNTISNNTVSLSGTYGYLLSSSDNNTISNNTVSLSGTYGYFLGSSDNNTIYHNNNLDNVKQAYDNSGTNSWDNGYPSGGNYWSDYSGTDIYRGPNQDQPGSDGVGDVPHPIDGIAANEDSFPLVFPVGTLGPPVNITASLVGPSFADVLLEWGLSGNDGGAPNYVTRYEILRGAGAFDKNGSGYQLIATLSNGSSNFVDSGKGEGDQENYFYIVCAVDVWNNTACGSDQAAKFTQPLSQGPNLLSSPLIQSNESAEVVLQTVSFDSAWFYDADSQMWKSHIREKSFPRTLQGLNLTMGIWINVTSNSNITVAGIVPSETSISLQPGWNLVGFPSFKEGYTAGDLKSETGSTAVEGFSPTNQPYHLRELADWELMRTGYGYWLWIDSAREWVVLGS